MIWFDYDQRELILWIVALGLTVGVLIYTLTRRKVRAGMIFPAQRLEGLNVGWRVRFIHAPLLLRSLAFALVLIALARPQITQEESAEVEGIDIVIAMDVSGSMSAVDMSEEKLIELQNRNETPVDRFNTAVNVIKDFIGSRRYDRVSLVVFGKQSFLQFPLTLDYGVMLKILEQMELGDVSGEGTAIGNALAMSLSRLQESEAKSKLIILLTDGEDRGSNVAPRQVAELSREKGIPIFPILVGSEEQSWQPSNMVDRFSGQRLYQQVESQVNPELLEAIAKITEGQFYRASDSESLSKDFRDILDSFEKSRLIDYAVAERIELFPYMIWAALACLMLELLLSTVVFRRYP
jgi:Ca-activated chloride channel family protein